MCARKQYFGALRGGWQRRAGSLATQLDYARAKIFSHFNYVAAIAGAAGLIFTTAVIAEPGAGAVKIVKAVAIFAAA